MENGLPPDGTHRATRQGWALNDKQVKYGGWIIAAVAIVAQLKGSFFTREEGDATAKELKEVKELIVALEKNTKESGAEIIRVVERQTDKIMETVDRQEARVQRDFDRITARVDNLELISERPKKNK